MSNQICPLTMMSVAHFPLDNEEYNGYYSNDVTMSNTDAVDDIHVGFSSEKTRVYKKMRIEAEDAVAIFAQIESSDRVPIHIRKRFIDARIRLGHSTRKSIAESIGVTINVINSIESGKALWSDVDKIVKHVILSSNVTADVQ